MTEFLCLGGPLHGQTLEVPEPNNGITIRPSEREELLRPAGAPPMPAVRYVLRGVTATTKEDKRFVRPVMAVEQMHPQHLMMALADVLVTTWVREGEEIDQSSGGEDADSGGVRRVDGRGGDASSGTGIAGQRYPLL